MGFEVIETKVEHRPEAKVDEPMPATAPERPKAGGKPKLTVVK